MKLSDLFVDYCELEGLQIVRVLDLDIFLAIRNSGGIADTTVVHYLSIEEIEKLRNNELTPNELYEREYTWHELREVEDAYKQSRIEKMIENAKKRGFFKKTK